MDLLTPHLAQINIPSISSPNPTIVYKEECVFSFDTPESSNGLFVCLSTFLGFSKEFVTIHHNKTGYSVYLKIKSNRVEISDVEVHPKKITKLAIGIDGGFNPDAQKNYRIEDTYSIVILPDFVEIPYPNDDLPEKVKKSVEGVIAAKSANHLELENLSSTWDGEERKISKHAENLVQLDNGVKIPSSGWKCQMCDLKQNLWLNLTDGSILCGRKFFDGSGGNNHALEHYEKHKYPIAVKLGTITSNSADVYSYDEDEMVIDPYLTKHLSHFGINPFNLEKTEKSIIEMEIDYNQRIGEWALIQESNTKLVPITGPGYTGIINLGNSCYLNSVLQLLFNIPEFQKRYFPPHDIYMNCPTNPITSFEAQMAKIAYGLFSGVYSTLTEPEGIDQVGIKPSMFKNFVGKSHSEFSTKSQQDAHEFLLHLINLIELDDAASGLDTIQCIKFKVEETIKSPHSEEPIRNSRLENVLSLEVPMDKALNKEEVEEYEKLLKSDSMKPPESVRSIIKLESCLESFCKTEVIDDYFHLNNTSTKVEKTTRIQTFPDYLIMQIKKFTFDDNWLPKKLNISLEVPDEIDLSGLRGSKSEESKGAEGITFNAEHLASLCNIGFKIDACKKALHITNHNGVEPALNWLLENLDNPDINTPFDINDYTSKQQFTGDNNDIETLMSMGISRSKASQALSKNNNVLEMAIDWIFNNNEENNPRKDQQQQLRDGSERYRLIGFISHMGNSTLCGHYVCHCYKDGKWVIFNDNKVGISENPCKGLAYLYLYKRI